jgi:predicted nucleotidyltransferase component of viral defense system
MISEAELRRHAVAAGVDTMVQDLDYGLGWFLAGLFTQTRAAQYLVFKGGTCLRKCYFADYRFSEDLDFTLRRAWPIEALAEALEQVRAMISSSWPARTSHWQLSGKRCRRSSQRKACHPTSSRWRV